MASPRSKFKTICDICLNIIQPGSERPRTIGNRSPGDVAHLWAERFDGDTAKLFALQDEITSRIAVALNLEMVAAEAARLTQHPDALDYLPIGMPAHAPKPTFVPGPEPIERPR